MAFPFIAAAMAAGAGLSFLSAKSSDKSSAKEASKSRDFTAEQMQKRHQWETRDLKKAGLNRILSATQGTPSMGSSAQAQVTNKADAITKGAALANLLADTRLKNSTSSNTDVKTKLVSASLPSAGLKTAFTENLLPTASSAAGLARATARYGKAKINSGIRKNQSKTLTVYKNYHLRKK